MSGSSDAVLGFRVHTGWAAVVALQVRDGVLAPLDRRRLEFEPPIGRFVYHQAAELAFEGAEKLVAAARKDTQAAATRTLKLFLAELRTRSIAASAAVIPTGNTRLPERLADILAAHSRIHSAEGVFYRETLADACAALGLSVQRPPERDLWTMAADLTGLGMEQLSDRMREIGKELGPPWGEDQKLATLAGWISAGRAVKMVRRARKGKPQGRLRVL